MPECFDRNEYPDQHSQEKNCEETDLYEQEDGVAFIGRFDGLIFNLAHSIHLLGLTLPLLPRSRQNWRRNNLLPTLHVDQFLDSRCCDKGSGKITSAGVEDILVASERELITGKIV